MSEVINMNDLPKNQNLDIVFVIDKSGSMYGAEKDTMGGFNSFIDNERKELNTKVTTVLFSNEYEMLYKRKPIDEVDTLTSETYRVGGTTALLDAIGKTIVDLDKEIDNNVLFVIMTDGFENSSIEYSHSQIKSMIANHKWEFIFIGADIDSYAQANRIGIRQSRTANYEKSYNGVVDVFESIGEASSGLRANGNLDEVNWNEKLYKYD